MINSNSTGEEIESYVKEHQINNLMQHLYHEVLFNLPDDPLEFIDECLSKPAARRVFILGAPNSGKTEQCVRLSTALGLAYVSIDEIIQDEIDEYKAAVGIASSDDDTDEEEVTEGATGNAGAEVDGAGVNSSSAISGKDQTRKKSGKRKPQKKRENIDKAKQKEMENHPGRIAYDAISSSGHWVPEGTCVECIKKRLAEPDVAEQGFVLDGFPRSEREAHALQINGIIPTAVIVLDLADKHQSLRRFGFSSYTIDFAQKSKESKKLIRKERKKYVQDNGNRGDTLIKMLTEVHFPVVNGNTEGYCSKSDAINTSSGFTSADKERLIQMKDKISGTNIDGMQPTSVNRLTTRESSRAQPASSDGGVNNPSAERLLQADSCRTNAEVLGSHNSPLGGTHSINAETCVFSNQILTHRDVELRAPDVTDLKMYPGVNFGLLNARWAAYSRNIADIVKCYGEHITVRLDADHEQEELENLIFSEIERISF